MTTLRTPPGMTSPPPTPSAPAVKCDTTSGGGSVTCTATGTGGTGSLAYEWFDSGKLIGTTNPLTVTLPPGEHFITVTVTGSNDRSVTSSATTVKVAGGRVSIGLGAANRLPSTFAPT